MRAALLTAGLLLGAAASAGAQQAHLLVVAGLGGDPTYREQFHEWATTLVEAATTRYDLPPERITYLGEDPDLGPDLIADRSTRENIAAAIDALAERSGRGDHVIIVLFGHGSTTGPARVNLPGRDLSADDYAELLDRLEGRRITFVNAASSSGPFIETLSGPDRLVMTATRSGGEWTASLFGGHFVEAFGDGEPEADMNKDSRVSMLEAFTYARLKVAQAYEADGLLLAEHALLDDDGDGTGVLEPDPLSGDGTVARTLFLASGEATASVMAFPDDPELRPLYDERVAIEARVESLRGLRDGLDAEQYEREFETLLVELALKSRKIRQLEEARGEQQEGR